MHVRRSASRIAQDEDRRAHRDPPEPWKQDVIQCQANDPNERVDREECEQPDQQEPSTEARSLPHDQSRNRQEGAQIEIHVRHSIG